MFIDKNSWHKYKECMLNKVIIIKIIIIIIIVNVIIIIIFKFVLSLKH